MAAFVAITGFMGSGKTSVGRRLAERLGWRFVDLDEEFVRAAGVEIGRFFETRGESEFRAEETRLLGEVLQTADAENGLVLSLGGGTLESRQARELLVGRGGMVLLDVECAEAWARSRGSNRPLAQEEGSFARLWRERRANYEAAADWVLPVRGRSVHSVAEEIAGLVRMAGPGWQQSWGRIMRHTARQSAIVGGRGAWSILEARADDLRSRGIRSFVVSDANVMRDWGDRLAVVLGHEERERFFVIDPGEGSKNAAWLARCWEWLAERGARRDDVLVALGGGVVGDLAGFAAATYQRGIGLWQVPSSLLAQVDSSVGGKTAVNLSAGKNLAGAFYQPDLVVIDVDTLRTLPEEEYAGGMGEVVKHALLMSEEALLFLEERVERVLRRDPDTMSAVVASNVKYKAGVVEADERESGLRAVLNLGHTTAHALEAAGGYGAIHHGRAVALGLLVSLALSERLLGLDRAVRQRTADLMRALGLQTRIDLPAMEVMHAAARRDKKVRAGSSGFVGLRALGEPVYGLDIPEEALEKAWEVIRK